MKIDVRGLKFYPVNNFNKVYRAVGHIDLYNVKGEIEGTFMIDIPRCIYDISNNELIGLATTEGELNE